jgi:hypothetical protein
MLFVVLSVLQVCYPPAVHAAVSSSWHAGLAPHHLPLPCNLHATYAALQVCYSPAVHAALCSSCHAVLRPFINRYRSPLTYMLAWHPINSMCLQLHVVFSVLQVCHSPAAHAALCSSWHAAWLCLWFANMLMVTLAVRVLLSVLLVCHSSAVHAALCPTWHADVAPHHLSLPLTYMQMFAVL